MYIEQGRKGEQVEIWKWEKTRKKKMKRKRKKGVGRNVEKYEYGRVGGESDEAHGGR